MADQPLEYEQCTPDEREVVLHHLLTQRNVLLDEALRVILAADALDDYRADGSLSMADPTQQRGYTFLTGGARSGKSSLAVRLAESSGLPVVFFATGEPFDDEMTDRIARHRAERPSHWLTVEAPLANTGL